MAKEIQAQIALSNLLDHEAKQFADQANLDTVKSLHRGREYSVEGTWYVYYEECEVVERKPNYLTVVSQNFSIPGLYKGGKFRIKRNDLLLYGKAYHSRHGDYFYIAPLSDRVPLPNSAVIGGNQQPDRGAMVLGTPHRSNL